MAKSNVNGSPLNKAIGDFIAISKQNNLQSFLDITYQDGTQTKEEIDDLDGKGNVIMKNGKVYDTVELTRDRVDGIIKDIILVH